MPRDLSTLEVEKFIMGKGSRTLCMIPYPERPRSLFKLSQLVDHCYLLFFTSFLGGPELTPLERPLSPIVL